jgi:hypothetical protein
MTVVVRGRSCCHRPVSDHVSASARRRGHTAITGTWVQLIVGINAVIYAQQRMPPARTGVAACVPDVTQMELKKANSRSQSANVASPHRSTATAVVRTFLAHAEDRNCACHPRRMSCEAGVWGAARGSQTKDKRLQGTYTGFPTHWLTVTATAPATMFLKLSVFRWPSSSPSAASLRVYSNTLMYSWPTTTFMLETVKPWYRPRMPLCRRTSRVVSMTPRCCLLGSRDCHKEHNGRSKGEQRKVRQPTAWGGTANSHRDTTTVTWITVFSISAGCVKKRTPQNTSGPMV